MDFYRIRKLGKGAFSDVFLIKNRQDDTFYCQKVMKPRYLKHVGNEKKILNILSKIKHPNIINFIQEEKMYNSTSLIFEYMFINLLNFYKQYEEHIKFYRICDYAWQLTNALQFIHRLFIIHCDLKPENIMINKQFTQLKIIDFGSSIINNQKKSTNFYIVSRYYRAPEISLQNTYNEKIDIWSLGCIIYELTILKPLFVSKNTIDHNTYMIDLYYSKDFNIINKIVNTNSVIYSNMTSNTQLKFIQFLDACIKFDQHERYSASELLELGIFDSFR